MSFFTIYIKRFFLLNIMLFANVVCSQVALAQPALSNWNTAISIQGGAFISVHGDIQLEDNGYFQNHDTIYLWGDWINNAGNTGFSGIGEGIVVLYDDTQTIRGNDVTHFYDLQCTGTGVKFADLNVQVDGMLDLTDRELNVQQYVVTVTNFMTNAVKSDAGFVSAVDSGGLSRYMDRDSIYFFPLGASQPSVKKRPVEIRPNDSNFNNFRLRMANVLPSDEGFDIELRAPDVCEVNPNFYHRIYQTDGNSPVDIRKYFIPSIDGNYSDILQWRDQPVWNKTTTANFAFSPAPAYSSVQINAWNNFGDFPFALGNASPELLTNLDDIICDGDTVELSTESGYPVYEFYVNGELVHIGTDDFFNVGGLSDGDSLWVVGIDSKCIAYSTPVIANVYDNPLIETWGDTTIYPGSDVHLFANGNGIVDWTPSSSIDCPSCFEATAENINQSTVFYATIEDMYGCRSTDSVLAIIDEFIDVTDIIFIPNAITPNDDGINDYWNIRNLHLFPDNEVIILNRWGDEVYRSKPYLNNWEGTYNGLELPDGTYYFILRVNDINQIVNGPLTILR
ncbi:MAG: gliding motility-associated C-terminal domain-containing protein [Chitinophagaceae bacterium]|nr:MAG: gliding motility-associated C-terminal domain-containing protein [Chitinophagaceae bacterium]